MRKLITGLLIISSYAGISQSGQGKNSAAGYKGSDKQASFSFDIKGNAEETWLVIENLSADLMIEGTSGSTVEILSSNYRGMPEKAKGLKPLSASGPENTGVGLSMKQDGNRIYLSGAHAGANNADYQLRVPKKLKLKVTYNGWQGGDVTIKGVSGEVEAKTQVGDLKFIDVTGPIVANTLSADLEAVFTSIASSSPTSLSSTSGDIDVTFPEATKGSFNMATMTGGVYTSHEFDFGEEDAGVNMMGGQNAKAKLNGGGVEVTLKSISGNIYLRKPE